MKRDKIKNLPYALLIRTQKILLHRHCEPKAKQSLNIGIASGFRPRNDNLVSAFVLVLSFLLGIVPLYAAEDNSCIVMDKGGNNVYISLLNYVTTYSLWQITASQIIRVDDRTSVLQEYPCIKMDVSGQNKYIAWCAQRDGRRRVFFVFILAPYYS